MKTKIWAHRGASGAAPENTLAAFDLAAKVGADGIELDVHFTRDREVVVVHDNTLARVTGMNGTVEELTLAQLKKLDFSNHMAAYCGERIPTLKEVLELIKPTGMEINIELKTDCKLPEGLEEATMELVARAGMEDKIWYSSFNHYSIARTKELDATTRCGLLYSNKVFQPWDYANALHVEAVHPHFASLNTPGYMEACHAAGIRCHAWTVNDAEDMRRLLEMGIDAIITNVPALAIAVRAEMEKR